MPLYEKPCSLKVMRYSVRLVDLNEYLDSLPGAIMTDKNVVTELNEISFNSMPNTWSKQSYAHGFYCGSISFLKGLKHV